MPELPPWIQPADETGAYAKGLALGATIAHQQAQQQLEQHKQELAQQQQQFYQQQALKEQQLAANRDARAQAELGLQAAAAARKSDAIMGFQKAVQSGTDPLKAMLQFGPAMGQPATAVAAAARALQPKPQVAPELIDLGGGVKGVKFGQRFQVLPQHNPPKWSVQERTAPDGTKYQVQVNATTGEEKAAPRPPETGKISQVDRDELREMERDLNRLEAEHEKDTLGASQVGKAEKELSPGAKQVLAAYKDREQKIAELKRAILEMRSRLRGGQTNAPSSTKRFVYDPTTGTFKEK